MHCLRFSYPINAMSFQNTTDNRVKFAMGSFNMDRDSNKVEVFELTETTTTSFE